MNAMAQTFYINLTSRPDRRDFMERQFVKLGIKAERIAAVTPGDISREMQDRYCDTKRLRWVSAPELGCTLSHKAVWQAVVDRNLPFALALEDDMALSDQLPNAIELVAAQSIGFDVLKVETKLAPILVGRPELTMGALTINRLYSVHLGTGAYFVSAAGARKLLAASDHFALFVDCLIFDPLGPMRSLRVRQLVPGLAVSVEKVDRTAPSAWSSLAETNKLNPPHRHAREFTPPIQRFFSRIWRDTDFTTRARIAIWRGAQHRTVPFWDDDRMIAVEIEGQL
jgi:GR25 family glycosyltransferase involved in LPS biosynthesis